ncbi:surp and g-patch domain-containing protein 1-like protein [Phtheirospermum japonicum]|uniref:Surp and g-patch domain-containing protein 1-like protein n=1 Tax=Phtheirospermum japonicum TaxID=374723 RepID=A0A830CPU6_9LAMI|nr:surp and g-patch domain-containing protein 1-like protein [Phtheirospermum japonicum]
MDKGIFVNDGSFMERFKQLQQEKEQKSDVLNKPSTPKTVISKTAVEFKANGSGKTTQAPSTGKLAFSLKQKSKLAAPPVKFDEDEDDKDAGNSSDDGPMKRPKLGHLGASDQSTRQVDVAPPSPSDPTVRKVADKLASFVAKNGRQFEHVTRQKNPGDTPFKFLFDESCSDYKYYEYRLSEEEKALSQTRESQTSQSGTTTTANLASASQRSSHHQPSKYQTPASALYVTTENEGSSHAQTSGRYGESSGPAGSDPIAMMEYYMKKAAQEEKRKPYKHSNDEMPPPASLQAPKKGHHMGDYIPTEELEKFLATCNDVSAQKAMKEYTAKAKIQADNVGHRLLSKMGWKEGEGLGSSKSGIANPIMAGDVKKDNLGVGAHAPGEVTADDDIYEQYKKRMMLGYRHRPNPLNNPRKSYY